MATKPRMTAEMAMRMIAGGRLNSSQVPSGTPAIAARQSRPMRRHSTSRMLPGSSGTVTSSSSARLIGTAMGGP